MALRHNRDLYILLNTISAPYRNCNPNKCLWKRHVKSRYAPTSSSTSCFLLPRLSVTFHSCGLPIFYTNSNEWMNDWLRPQELSTKYRHMYNVFTWRSRKAGRAIVFRCRTELLQRRQLFTKETDRVSEGSAKQNLHLKLWCFALRLSDLWPFLPSIEVVPTALPFTLC